MKIKFGSVIYKGAADYFNDFVSSLKDQSNKGFEVLLINDDYGENEQKELERQMGKLRYIISKPLKRTTPAKLRVELMRRAKMDNADLLVLGDCDDYFSADRVESVKRAYIKDRNAAFYYNPILDFEGNPIMDLLPGGVYDYSSIGEYNFLGLSNTAINLNMISESEIDSMEEFEGKVFDWYFFSRILLLGKYGIKMNSGKTFYRIHAGNIAGAPKYSEEKIRAEIEVKRNHYYQLKKYDRYYQEKYEQYCSGDSLVIHDKGSSRFWWDLTSYQS